MKKKCADITYELPNNYDHKPLMMLKGSLTFLKWHRKKAWDFRKINFAEGINLKKTCFHEQMAMSGKFSFKKRIPMALNCWIWWFHHTVELSTWMISSKPHYHEINVSTNVRREQLYPFSAIYTSTLPIDYGHVCNSDKLGLRRKWCRKHGYG